MIGPGSSECHVEIPGIKTEKPVVVFLTINDNGDVMTMENTLYSTEVCTPTTAIRTDGQSSSSRR